MENWLNIGDLYREHKELVVPQARAQPSAHMMQQLLGGQAQSAPPPAEPDVSAMLSQLGVETEVFGG